MSDIRTQIRSQGFTHVLTYGGPVALDDWTPYGKHPDAIPFYLDGDTLREHEDPARPRPSGPVVTGLWRLLRVPTKGDPQ